MDAHPNVLFILADQWRGSALGLDSDPLVRTPHLDHLAEQGQCCERAYATNPVCTPNRACLFTGRYSHQTGMIGNDLMLPPEEVCFPEIFEDAGYATHYIGKWHLDGEERPGFVPQGWRRRGFQSFEGFNRGHVYHEHWGFDDQGDPLPWEKGGNPYFEPTLQTELALDFMKRDRKEPFLCFLSWGPPHNPFQPPAAFDHYQPETMQFRPNVPDWKREEAAADQAGYFGLCEALDHEMGRLLDFLDQSGLSENTLVIFTSDHGELLGSHGKYHKGEPEEESVRVPLLLRYPGVIPESSTTNQLIETVDLMPTLLDLCQLSIPESCSGKSHAKIHAGEELADDSRTIYCQGKMSHNASKEWRCLITPTHKLTLEGRSARVTQLFSLKEDPFEMNNLAGKGLPEEKELLQAFHALARQRQDPYPGLTPPAQVFYSDAEAREARSKL